jgi:predicted alpha/beta hydrolase
MQALARRESFNMSAALPALHSPNLALLHASLGLGPEEARHRETLVHLPLGGDRHLVARWFEPLGVARATALMAPATGVSQRFYAAMARWLAGRGYAVLTFDYAGLAASREAASAGASMRDWMLRDLPLALNAVQQRAAEARLPIVWIGHSLGGHALPLQPALGAVDAALCIGSQLPAFHRWPAGHRRWGARFFFKRYVPWLVRLTGRLPSWSLGGGEDLPGEAALDWSRWGQMPNYFASDRELADHLRPHAWQGVAHFWCVSDDWVFGPEPAVQALVDLFDGAQGEAQLRRLHPHDVGLQRLGHFAPFGRHAGERLWPKLMDELEASTPALRRPHSYQLA